MQMTLAKNEESIKKIMRRLKDLKGKSLELNIQKSKILCFRKGGGRNRRIKWMWKGKEIEEVLKFKYLSYVLKKNEEEDDGQIRELKNKGNIVTRKVWDLGERRFKDDFRRRMMLFKYLWR